MKQVKYKKLMTKLYRAEHNGCSLNGLKLSQAKKGYLKNRGFVIFRPDGYCMGLQQWRVILSKKGREHCRKMGVV